MKINEASMGQEQKKLIASKLKPVLAKYGIKGTLSVRNKSTISLLISEGTIDFIGNSANVMANDVFGQPNHYSTVRNEVKNGFMQVNIRHIENHFSGKAKDALLEIAKVLNTDNYSKSDWTNDWVQVGHYVSIDVGRFDKPYKCTGTLEKPNAKLQAILGDQFIKESKLVQDKTKLIATIKQILKPSNTSIKVEGGKDDSMVVTITKSDIDFVSNYAKVQTSVPNPTVIRVSQSIPGLKLQFDGEAFTVFHKLLNALSKEGLTLDKSTTPFISFKIVPKTFKYTGNKEQGLMEDAKQLIQNPILKVFDQFGKQYLAQVLDASLNKMIQAAARRGVKVTVPQLIAEIKDKPNGTTSQALFKAMATVIKQVSAQIPTIVTTNVSSIS